MKIFRITAILIPLLCAAALVLADDFKSDEDAYAYGFRAGYNQGVTEGSARMQFDYRRSHAGPNAISFNSYNDDNFQKGYQDGYTDGFYREQRTRNVPTYTNSNVGTYTNSNVGTYTNNAYDPQGFRVGYREGYTHGSTDRQMGLDFNYRHDHRFESGVSYGSYTTAQFQLGYEQGYKQGYYGAALDDGNGYRPSSNVLPSARGSVIAFTDDDFHGQVREFGVGRYSDLDGDWDDSIESIQIRGPVRVILFADDDFKGKQLVIERTTKDLDDFNFDEKAGSMIVEPLY